MTLFKSPFSRLSHKSSPVVATNISLGSWCYQSLTQSTRFVKRIEMCTALSAGEDAWGSPLDKNHYHTLLRVSLAPTCSGHGASAETLLIERVLSTGGARHSVTPIQEAFPIDGTLLHPRVHDRVCVISNGPSTALAHHLEVERTLTFGTRASEPRITLAQFARIIEFIGRTTKLVCDGGDCRFQSRSFAFTCLAALAPTLPHQEAGEGLGTRVGCGTEMVDDSMYELSAEAFLVQVPRMFKDPASIQALDMIEALKDTPRERVATRLYH